MPSSLTVSQICSWIEELAPKSLAEPWDQVGLQIGDGEHPVSRVLVALTLTHHVIDQAVDLGSDMIVVHHPLIFDPITRVDPHSRVGSLLTRLVTKGMPLYVTHTNLDAAVGGVNDGLAIRLQLVNVETLSLKEDPKDTSVSSEPTIQIVPGIGRIGYLPRTMSVESLTRFVAERLSLSSVRVIGRQSDRVEKVAVVGGSGGSYIATAKHRGADVLITGDIDFHDADEALFSGLTVIDAGHFGTEKHMPVDMAQYISHLAVRRGLRLDVAVAEERDPFQSIAHRDKADD